MRPPAGLCGVLSDGVSGSVEMTFQPGCPARNPSGSSQGRSVSINTYSPSEGQLGQYISCCTLKPQGSNMAIPHPSATRRAIALYSSASTSLSSGTTMRQRGLSFVCPCVVYSTARQGKVSWKCSTNCSVALSASRVSIERDVTFASRLRPSFRVPPTNPPWSLALWRSSFGIAVYSATLSGVLTGLRRRSTSSSKARVVIPHVRAVHDRPVAMVKFLDISCPPDRRTGR